MSDLHQAVQAEIDAYTPAAAPPFAVLVDRRRARGRRRLATGGAALSALAVVAAAASAPTPGGGRDELPTVGGTAQAATELDELVERCLAGAATTPVTGMVGMTEQEAFAPNARSALRVVARDGACAEGSAEPVPGMTDVVLDQGRVVWAAERTALPDVPDQTSPVPPQDPAGAELCKGSGNGFDCYDLGPARAGELAAALATGKPRQQGPECAAAPAVVYRVTWLPLSGITDPVVWTVPWRPSCVPMHAADTRYALGQEARDLVARLWDSAGLSAVDETTTGRHHPSAPRG